MKDEIDRAQEPIEIFSSDSKKINIIIRFIKMFGSSFIEKCVGECLRHLIKLCKDDDNQINEPGSVIHMLFQDMIYALKN